MAVVHIFTVDLTGARRQQVLQGPKTVLDPGAPLPRPDEPRPADSRVETHDVELLLRGLTDHDDRHCAIRWTGRPQPRIAHVWSKNPNASFSLSLRSYHHPLLILHSTSMCPILTIHER